MNINPTKHMKPGYEWDERWRGGSIMEGTSPVSHLYLRPVRKDHVWDNHNGVYLAEATPFKAYAVLQEDGTYEVVTQAGGAGGRRYRTARTLEEAMEILQAWYWRRFRFVDEPRGSWEVE